jgi:hypothetical protein
MKRTDEHKPSSIIPEDYEYVAQEVFPSPSFGSIIGCQIVMDLRAKIQAHMNRTGGTYSGHEHGGNCMVCGSVNAIYTVLFYHAKSNTYVRMGQDCAMKCEMGDPEAFRTFRTQIQDAVKRNAGKAKAEALLNQQGLSEAWTIFLATDRTGWRYEENTILDIVWKLVQYGSLSDKQFSFLGTLLQKIGNRAAEDARRAAELANAKDCPEGRMEILGTILTTKTQESQYGITLKMLVKADDGWKVWGTVPSSIAGEDERGLKGRRIQFSATIQRSKDDPKFGFFKRPTCAKMA